MPKPLTRPKREPQTISLQDAFAVFLDDRRARRCTPRTLHYYHERLTKFIAWCQTQNCASLTDLKPASIRAYFVHLQERNLSDYTIHASARAIRAFCNFCVSEELLAVTPMAKVAMPKLDHRVLPSFSASAVQLLLGAAESYRDKAIILFLLDTGVRSAELLNLNGADIDSATGTIAVVQGKGRKDRTVFMGAKSRKALMRYYAQRGRPTSSEPVWTNTSGTSRLTDSGLRQMLSRIGAKAKVDHCHPHTFRRTFAIESLRAGMNIYVLARLMGHTDIAVLRRYLPLVDLDLKRAHIEAGSVNHLLK